MLAGREIPAEEREGVDSAGGRTVGEELQVEVDVVADVNVGTGKEVGAERLAVGYVRGKDVMHRAGAEGNSTLGLEAVGGDRSAGELVQPAEFINAVAVDVAVRQLDNFPVFLGGSFGVEEDCTHVRLQEKGGRSPLHFVR